MMSKTPHCPRCGSEVDRSSPFLPFCSERCRLLDLGRWIQGNYRIAGEKVDLQNTGPVPEEPHNPEG